MVRMRQFIFDQLHPSAGTMSMPPATASANHPLEAEGVSGRYYHCHNEFPLPTTEEWGVGQ